MSTPTCSPDDALPDTPVTLIELVTAAPASGMLTSLVFSKYGPVDGGVPPLSISPLISAYTWLIFTPPFRQPPQCCNAITLCEDAASTGEPDEPGAVSQ